mmetsp:Transcript_2278/g.3286  ORF Transcript_2278/g.3286 Transcript_2278/m.3286 type:complete len:176 (+) Transcript_2278:97-624(+)
MNVTSTFASQRLCKLLQSQEQAKNIESERKAAILSKSKRRTTLGTRLMHLGSAINRINPAKWIDDLEKDQNLADELEEINYENSQEEERKAICREAQEACLQALREHLESFLDEYPQGLYEDWVKEVHPDNVHHKKIDHRFYVEASDHRKLWNYRLEDSNGTVVRKYVPAIPNQT